MTNHLEEINIPAESKRAILNNQLALWKNTLYEAQVQSQVAAVIGNQQLKDAAAARAEEAIRALDALRQIEAELSPAASGKRVHQD